MSCLIENFDKFSWLFKFSSIVRKNSNYYKLFNVLIKLFIEISSRTDIIELIIQELIIQVIIEESIISSTVSVMRDCWMLILFTILITLTVRLIVVINELAALIIVILLLSESLFECSHNICFLSDWVRVHLCFFDS